MIEGTISVCVFPFCEMLWVTKKVSSAAKPFVRVCVCVWEEVKNKEKS